MQMTHEWHLVQIGLVRSRFRPASLTGTDVSPPGSSGGQFLLVHVSLLQNQDVYEFIYSVLIMRLLRAGHQLRMSIFEGLSRPNGVERHVNIILKYKFSIKNNLTKYYRSFRQSWVACNACSGQL